ncbi:alpha/beta fold hydrolase [Parasphingopyxis marina]|uniref:Alpha/beta hydrolase n=1 Tax=Parasphingopyxis marina TaxID=2761622 RepID=A0A842HTM1_9SPHN|nr:alpha/beta hydrolase [Parasphingopyxis marina]MBC2776372.1 alpha/beta hydrolase [Parasphingopyxis marina]
MAVFVLVHGAWSGGWGYREVAAKLRAAGHEVHVPTMTGLGDRAHLASPAITLSTHVADVLGMIESEDLDDIVLVGHSYGGMVVTGVATKIGAKIRSLVYLDAFLPGDGEALWDIADEAARKHYIDAQKDEPGFVAPLPMPPGVKPLRTMNRHPLLTLLEPVHFTGKEAQVKNRTYIYATRDAPTIFTQFYETVKDAPQWRVHEIATGHIVMLDDPEGLTRLLLAEVDR